MVEKSAAAKRPARLPVVLAICLVVALVLCASKSGYFLDEVYTYTLSNSHYAPFPKQAKGGDMTETTFTKEDVRDMLTVQEDERFDAGSVWYNQSLDVHPPLFYLLMNVVSSLVPNTFSKWIGLSINLTFYMVTLVLLYLLARRLLASENWALAAVMLYGLSQAGLSDMLYIRMYQMLTAATLALALEVLCLRNRWGAGRCIAVGATIAVGMLVQYYFVIYAFFLSLTYALGCLRGHKYGHLATYSACALAGVGLFCLVFPSALTQIGSGGGQVSGGSALQGLVDLSSYPYKLAEYIYFLLRGMPVVMALGVVGLVLCVKGRGGRKLKTKGEPTGALAICLPAVADMGLVAVISPYASLRYGYNVCPLLVLCALALVRRGWDARRCGRVERRSGAGVCAPLFVAAALSLALTLAVGPDYLFTEVREYNALLAPYYHAPAVFVNSNSNPAITSDLPQLLAFDDVYVTDDPASVGLASYVRDHGDDNHLVVFVDTYAGFNPAETSEALCQNLAYAQARSLYSNEWSAVYLLTRE